MTDEKSIHDLSVDEKLALIDDLCEDLFKENQAFIPMYPMVFVLVCQKAQKVGSIFLPDKQNKTVHEGIVLATWNDKEVQRGITHYEGRKVTRHEILHSELSLGDRVLFQHWAGCPAPGYDADRFRLVRERDWEESKQGGIFAKVKYDADVTKPLELLMEMIDSAIDPNKEIPSSLLKAKIEDRFLVVDREAASVTLSGR